MLNKIKRVIMKINKLEIYLLAGLFILMILTRGSHITTPYSLPDASLAIFLIGGIYLKNFRFFIALFLLGLFIDFGASALNPKLGFCLTNGYWGLIPAYASLWICGYFLKKQKYLQKLSIFIPSISVAVVVAFLISTHTYYLFSGRFGSPSITESLLHGWEYLPQYFLSSFIYISFFWLTQNIIMKNKIFSNLKKFKPL
jgi:uncharacterized membrane protein YeaQ/YmgE (transglycosylase-associated protein family)